MSAWETLKSIVLWKEPEPPVRSEVRELIGVRPITSQANRAQWPKRDVNVYTRDAYASLALIFRCVQFLSQSVAVAPLRVYPTDSDDPDESNPIRQLLTHPNRESNEARFLSQVTLTMAVAGFCVIEKERSANGRVVGLWPINPAYCKPIPRADASPDWEIVVPGYPPVTLYAEDVIVVTFADRPDQTPTGIGPLEVLLRQWGLLNVMDEFLYKFFQNDALPQYVLVPKEGAVQKQTDADILRTKWRQYTGLDRASFGPPIMDSIADVKRIGFDLNELAYKDIRDITELAICSAFGIPPILVGTSYGLERSTFANYGEARRSYYEDTISPLWNRIEDAVGRSLFFEFSGQPGRWRLNFDVSDVPAMRDDVLPRQQLAVQAFTAGGMSRHQLAAELGIEPKGPDVFLQSALSVDVPATVVSGKRNVRVAERRAMLALPETRQRIGVINRTAYLRVADKFAPKFRSFLEEQGQRVQAALGLRAAGAFEQRDVAELVNWDEEDDLLEDILRSLINANGQVATQLSTQALGDDSVVWTVTNPRIKALVDTLAQRVVGINATTREGIERVVTESLTEGVTMEELSGRLTDLFEATYAGRAMTIARSESQVAYNQASVLAYQESGVVEQAELLDNADHTEDYGAEDGLSCAERNGLIVELADVDLHIQSEHPNGTLAVAPYFAPAS